MTGGYTGCMADVGEDGLLWQASSSIQGGDRGQPRDAAWSRRMWPAGGAYGISIDFEGYVWAVAFGLDGRARSIRRRGEFWTYNGLVGCVHVLGHDRVRAQLRRPGRGLGRVEGQDQGSVAKPELGCPVAVEIAERGVGAQHLTAAEIDEALVFEGEWLIDWAPA